MRQKCNDVDVDPEAIRGEHTKTGTTTISSTDESGIPPIRSRGWSTKSGLVWNGVFFLASMVFFSITAGLY
jgi:hypothetical protein